jgi:hypothetical protein
LGALQIAKRRSRFQEEDVFVINLSSGFEARSEAELSSQNGQRSRAYLDSAIVAGFGLVPIDTEYSGLVDTHDSLREIDIRERQRDLLRRSQPCEEAKFIVVTLRFAPVPMDSGDERFGVVHGKRIHLRSVGFPQPGTAKVYCWILMDGPVPVSELECAFQDADGVVVSFLTPRVPVRDRYQP